MSIIRSVIVGKSSSSNSQWPSSKMFKYSITAATKGQPHLVEDQLSSSLQEC